MNGISIFSINDTNNFNGVNDLTISNESSPSDQASFGGYITYFSWVKGAPLYTANFTVSNNYPTLTNDYVLLLKASSFDGTLGSAVINTNVSTIQNVPPNFLSNNNNNRSTLKNLKSLFTDNSFVFYKPGSLASCGVGSVRNSSTKSRRI
jgi:LPS O-antigen subunit length determinant protein (WzzB/FepE family)